MNFAGSLRRAAAAGLLGLWACADGSPSGPEQTIDESQELVRESKDVAAPKMSTVYNSAPNVAVCGSAATYKLWAGASFPGKVVVGNDRANLYVTYETGPKDWFVSDTRVSVSKTVQKIPVDARGRIDPWSFPLTSTHTPPTKAYTYSISLASLQARAGDKLVVAAWAGLVYPKTGDWSGPWSWTTAWGLGNISGSSLADLSNYTVQSCPDAPPEPPRQQAVISITFDDGWEETYTRAFPVLKEHGLVANSAVWPVAIDDGYGGFMDIGQVRALKAAGWAIVSHSMTHPYLTTVTDAQLDYELKESQAWIRRNGLGSGDFFVIPFHNWGDRERAAIKRYYKGARGTSAIQYNPPVLQAVPIQDPYSLTSFEPEFAPYTTPEGRAITKEYLDRAVAEGAYIDILFHHVPAETMPQFREMVNILAGYKQYIRTYEQIVPH